MKNWLAGLFKTYFVVYFPFVVVFLAALYNSADSDLGWHLKYGEYFFRYFAILRNNIFSTDMPDFRWINSSWATDLLSYLAFSRLGFLGISILGTLAVTAAFYFISKAAKLSFWEKAILFPVITYLEEPLNVVSFRGHQLSLLFITILLFLFREFENGKKQFILFIIPLFTIWSNFHGEFILGLAIFLGWIFFHIIRLVFMEHKTISKNLFEKSQKPSVILGIRQLAETPESGWDPGRTSFAKMTLKLIIRSEKIIFLTFIFSVLATFVNPFGIGPYLESVKHFGNPLQKYIIEWLPFNTYSELWWNLVIWSAVLIISFIIIIKKKLFTEVFPFLGLTFILLILTFSVRRYAWPMYYVSVIPAAYFIRLLKPNNKILATILPTVILIIFYLYISQIQFPSQRLGTMNWDRYCKEFGKCSPPSAEFLKTANLKGNMLTFYNWGGWLIWNYPEVKPSIDGRMHLWQDEKGYSAFKYYYPLEQNWQNVDESKYDIVYMTPAKPMHKQMMALVKENKWKIVYQDKYAYIFTRVKN